jgi:hypothetical protein
MCFPQGKTMKNLYDSSIPNGLAVKNPQGRPAPNKKSAPPIPSDPVCFSPAVACPGRARHCLFSENGNVVSSKKKHLPSFQYEIDQIDS